ncbi:hypothetical protein [Changchengzhania lutea]|uniref:hypothetical protein n=1 Tax=Changchengzhania lutea TaxID=2049305 RepID=UPI00115E4DA6|nr:hypothetical protein [Changchengzhania lutea]
MKPLKAILFILSICLCFSCNNLKQQYSDGLEDDILAEKDILKAPIMPYNLKKGIAFDFDNNNTLDSLYLSAQVEVDSLGRSVWDDAQAWRVTIKSNDLVIELYNKNIQLGKLEVEYDTILNHIYIIENAPHQKGLYKIEPLINLNVSVIDSLPRNRKSLKLTLE